MGKTILKELMIVILLIIAIGLLLTIIFYQYIPNNKTVPIKMQAYELPDDVKTELRDAGVEEQNIIKTYLIDDSDLNVYESTKDYNKGKPNPFSDYGANNSNTSENTSGNTSGNGGTSNNTSGGNSNTVNNNVDDDPYIATPGKTY